MQCPNCRKIEKGNWLYANGFRPAHDVSMDEWAHDEDLYDVSYSEMVCDYVNLTDAWYDSSCLSAVVCNMQMVKLTILFFWIIGLDLLIMLHQPLFSDFYWSSALCSIFIVLETMLESFNNVLRATLIILGPNTVPSDNNNNNYNACLWFLVAFIENIYASDINPSLIYANELP
jgi:hypothetical protein